MHLKVLGTRAKIEASAEAYKNHSGYLIDDKILLDLGESDFLEEKHEAIIFTHFHPDHAYFVFDKVIFKSETPHYGPEEHFLAPELLLISDIFKVGDYTITPYPVIHSLNVKSFAYLVEKGNKKVFFTGDVALIGKAVLKNLPKVDLIVTEATFIEEGGCINRKGDSIYGHTDVPDLIRFLKPYTQKILLSHYGEWFYKDIPKAIERLNKIETEDLKVIPAYDGLVIII